MTATTQRPKAPKQDDVVIPERATMDYVVMDRVKLIKTLEDNRAAHRKIFEEALVGYKKEALKLLGKHIERIKKNKVTKVFVSLPEPSDHTDDYDRAIAALKASPFNEVRLSIHEFDTYVRDSWGWKQEWTASNTMYAASLQSH